MKNKEKQITEMAKDILNAYNVNKLYSQDVAKFLYEQGYRKLPEDSVVLSKEEYKRLLDNAIRVDMEYLDHELVKASKETAEKILKDLIKNCQYTFGVNGKPIIALDGDFALNTAKSYGVKIEG